MAPRAIAATRKPEACGLAWPPFHPKALFLQKPRAWGRAQGLGLLMLLSLSPPTGSWSLSRNTAWQLQSHRLAAESAWLREEEH